MVCSLKARLSLILVLPLPSIVPGTIPGQLIIWFKKGEVNLATSRESQKNKESKVTRRLNPRLHGNGGFIHNEKLYLEGQESNELI